MRKGLISLRLLSKELHVCPRKIAQWLTDRGITVVCPPLHYTDTRPRVRGRVLYVTTIDAAKAYCIRLKEGVRYRMPNKPKPGPPKTTPM